jgi:hypothetical protein
MLDVIMLSVVMLSRGAHISGEEKKSFYVIFTRIDLRFSSEAPSTSARWTTTCQTKKSPSNSIRSIFKIRKNDEIQNMGRSFFYKKKYFIILLAKLKFFLGPVS